MRAAGSGRDCDTCAVQHSKCFLIASCIMRIHACEISITIDRPETRALHTPSTVPRQTVLNYALIAIEHGNGAIEPGRR